MDSDKTIFATGNSNDLESTIGFGSLSTSCSIYLDNETEIQVGAKYQLVSTNTIHLVGFYIQEV